MEVARLVNEENDRNRSPKGRTGPYTGGWGGGGTGGGGGGGYLHPPFKLMIFN